VNRRRVTELFRAQALAFARDRTALFFTFLFPLMFLVVFGLLFNDANSSRPTLLVSGHGAVADHLPGEILRVKRVDDPATALRRVRDGDEPAYLAQDGDRVTLVYAASDQVQGATIRGIVASVVSTANLRALGATTPPIALEARQVEDESLSSIEFLTPGLLGWAIATSAVFGAALTFVTWRDKRVLRRMRLSPVRLQEIALSRVSLSLAIGMGQVVVYIVVARVLFGLSPTSAWWMCFPLAAAGTLAFLSVGLLVGAFSKTAEAASAVANLIVLPMAFLSGAFFPLDGAPGWVQAISEALPMRHLIEGLTDTMVRGRGAASALPAIGICLAFAAVLGAIATLPRVFRWDAT